jgi:hypothetical protein
MRWEWTILALVACGDNLPPSGSFRVVGHADLGARGMNSALAIADDTAYVGSRIDSTPIAIVDIADPRQPTVVGEIGPGLPAISSRELRAVPDRNLLIVLNLKCSPSLHGCANATAVENLAFYDITDRRTPVLAATYPIAPVGPGRGRSPHEMFVWRDATRVLVLLTTPPGPPSFEVVDASDPHAPAMVVQWDPIVDGHLSSAGLENILHSVSASKDGRVGYFSHQQGGLVLVDLGQIIDRAPSPQLAMITPPTQVLDFAPPSTIGPHSAVQAPGRDLLVVTEEVYPPPYGSGCPWGHLRTVDISDPTTPTIVGDVALPENDPSFCAGNTANESFTSHNATVTPNLVLVTWYAAGLEAIDISDATKPSRLGEFRPDPLPSVTHEDPGLGGNPIEMWSYPIIDKGLIYVVDVRNGLYVLRYDGLWGEQVSALAFSEGNSNL